MKEIIVEGIFKDSEDLEVRGCHRKTLVKIEITPPTEEQKKNLKEGQKVLLLATIRIKEHLYFKSYTLGHENLEDDIVYIFPLEKEGKKEIDFEKLKINFEKNRIYPNSMDISKTVDILVDIIKSLKQEVEDLKEKGK